jgi:hypothetical protein
MFADSWCESASTNRSRRAWITLASFGAQALAVSGLLTLPFLVHAKPSATTLGD